MSKDTIYRQAAIDEAEEWIEIAYCERGGQRERDAIRHVIKGIKKLPSAQPEQETGRWHKKGGMIYCSKCSTGFEMYFVNDFIYCPHCGERKKGTDE